ncbi:MAG: tetratricopeptide repeat protein [Elusimicrobiota bacterium]
MPAARSASSEERDSVRTALLVAAATLLVFSRSLTAGFLDLDDPFFVVQNAHLRQLTWVNLRWMFSLDWILWYPLTWLTYAADYAVWGLRPAGYHLTSVLLHALNAGLAYRLFDRLMLRSGAREELPRRAAAACGALFFALNPLRVESVTWVSERSDVLSGAFSLATALAWVEGLGVQALLLHAAALASKSVSMTVPAALGLVDALGLSGRRWPGFRREVRALAPMLVLSAAAAGLAAWSQVRVGAAASFDQFGLANRLAVVAWSYAHGLAKTFVPVGLEGFYPTPHPFRADEPRFLLAAALVALVSVLAWRRRRTAPAFAAAWGAYLVIMAPTAGFLKVGAQLICDRYTYLSALGIAGLAAEALRRALSSRRRTSILAAAATGLIALSALSWARQGDWMNADRFWGAMAEADEGNAIARFSLARCRLKENRPAEAEILLRQALAIDSTLTVARIKLGTLLFDTGRTAEAIADYRAAIAASPRNPFVRYNLALALASLGRRAEAEQELRDELGLIAAAPRDPLRDELHLEPDEARTRALLDALLRR